MIPPHNLVQIQTTCETIRQAYHGRRNYRLNLIERRETLAEEARQIRDQLLQETDENNKSALKQQVSDTVDALSAVDRELSVLEQSLSDIENDYDINQCPAVRGSIG